MAKKQAIKVQISGNTYSVDAASIFEVAAMLKKANAKTALTIDLSTKTIVVSKLA